MNKAYLVIRTDEEGYHLVVGVFTDKKTMYKEIRAFIDEQNYENVRFSDYSCPKEDELYTYEDWVASDKDYVTVSYSDDLYDNCYYLLRIFKGVLNASFNTKKYREAVKKAWNE